MNAISNVLSVMSLVGLWTPHGWGRSWKGIVYKMYAKILDTLLLTYFILKTIHTYFSINRNHLDILLESLFESLYIMILILQRFMVRWVGPNLRITIQELSSLPCGHPLFRAYEKHSRRVSIILALGGIAAAMIYLVNFLIATNTDTTWSYGLGEKANPWRRLFVEIWLPFDETVSPYYEIVQSIDLFCMIVTCTSLYIFSSLIPLLVVRICCHFRVIATELEKNLAFEQRNSIIQCRNWDTEEKRDLKSLIQYHQSVLRLVSMMNSLFHWIILLKIVLLSLPVMLCALTLSQSSFGSFHFLRYVLLMSIPLMELFLFCWYGEQLRTHGLLVHKAVYFCPWYLMVSDLQRCLIIVSTRALKPVQLEIMPHFIPVSLETFIGVTRLSYSAYTLLLTVTSSNKHRAT